MQTGGLHCKEDPNYVFPEIKLLGLVSQFPYSYTCERFMYFQDRSIYFAAAKSADRPWELEYINSSQVYECRNWH